MRVRFIVNPIAGGGKAIRRILPAIHHVLSDAPFSYDIQMSRERGDAAHLAEEGISEGYDRIVAVGGDGTIHEVATPLVGTDAELGIIPFGSGNGLARGLKIPLNPERACRALVTGMTRRIDVGRIGDRYFFVTAGMGLDAALSLRYDEEESHGKRGMWPYVYLTVAELGRFKAERTTLTLDGRQTVVKPILLTIANSSQYGGGATIAPEARPDDGVFDVCVIHDMHMAKALYHALKLFTGRIAGIRQMEIFRARTVDILPENPTPYHLDGEPFEAIDSLHIELLPGALSVVVPEETGGRKA